MQFNRASTTVVTPATTQVVSLADVLDRLRLNPGPFDRIVDSYIVAATAQMKMHLQAAVADETMELTLDGFVGGDWDDKLLALGPGVHNYSLNAMIGGQDFIDLPFPPIKSVVSVKTYDRANNESTFSADAYRFDANTGRLYLNEGYTWPSSLRSREAVKVQYTIGWSAVPTPIKEAIRVVAADMYEGSFNGVEEVAPMVQPWRRVGATPW